MRSVSQLIQFVVFISIAISASYGLNKVEFLQKCKQFLETNPKPYPLQLAYLKEDNAYMGNFRKVSAKYVLHNYIKFNSSEAVIEQDDVTSVCVSVIDTTSYTNLLENPDNAVAWVTFNTRTEIPAAIINIPTPCWKKYKYGSPNTCSAVFIPMSGFMDSALYNHSPLSEEFWNHVQDDTVYEEDWIWRMNFQSTRESGSINSSWVPRLNISSLIELKIVGNDWRKPEFLMGSLPRLQKLDLSYNNIEVMPNDTSLNLPDLKNIILGHNNISKLPYGLENLQQLYLVDLTNPIGNATLSLSDDEISTLSRVVILGLERSKLVANVTEILGLPNIGFLNLSGCFLGKIDDQSTSNLIQNSRLQYLDLSFNNLVELPTDTLFKTHQMRLFYVHDNKLESFWNNSFSSMTELVYLDASRNRLNYLHHECFSNLHKLEELNLSWNKLVTLHPLIFRNTTKLKKLLLSHNSFSLIHYEVFLSLSDLYNLDLSFNRLITEPIVRGDNIDSLLLANNSLTEIHNLTHYSGHINYLDLSGNLIQKVAFKNVDSLNLSYNSLTHISKKMWLYLDGLKTVDLGRNLFDCCHNDTSLMQHRLNSTHHAMTYLGLNETRLFTCFINRQEVQLEKFHYNSSLCLEEGFSGNSNLYIEIGVAVFFLLSLVTVAMALLYFYRTELTYIGHLFKMKKRGWEKDEERYSVCSYDAFVCYSGNNLKWVAEELLPNLENGPEGYRLCLHDRDFTLGAAIDTNVIASLEKSRKVIFVLSENFIGSRWCQWELEMANHKMFEENRGYIILIELERMDKKNMPRHLRYLMDTRTYLEWPQDPTDQEKVVRCWKRLRHALGDSIFKRTGRDAPKCSVLDQ